MLKKIKDYIFFLKIYDYIFKLKKEKAYNFWALP